MQIVRTRAGRHFAIVGHQLDEQLVTLRPATQDENTGRWLTGDERSQFTTTEAILAAKYEAVPAEPLRDPRITRLTGLVEQLLAEHQQTTGQPAAAETEIRAVLAEVAKIPEEWSRKRTAAAANARR